MVVALPRSHDKKPVILPHTRAVMFPHETNKSMVRMRVNVTWNLLKGDFLHFIAPRKAGMGRKRDRQDPSSSPSMTRQEPYVQAIGEALGEWEIPAIVQVREVQKGTRSPRSFHQLFTKQTQ